MGKADVVTKNYMRQNHVFADAFNYLIYGGENKFLMLLPFIAEIENCVDEENSFLVFGRRIV